MIGAILFYTVAIFSGLARRLLMRVGFDALDMGDYISGKPHRDDVRGIVESWKPDNDDME
jgi:hypothetical protein